MTEKAQAASMMARKSRVDIVICCGGGAEVLGPVIGSGGVEDAGVLGNGVVTKDAGT